VKQLTGYYLSVVELLQRRYGLNTGVLDAGATAGGRHGDANIEAARRVAHQSFIYLGDLCTLLAASRLQGHPGWLTTMPQYTVRPRLGHQRGTTSIARRRGPATTVKPMPITCRRSVCARPTVRKIGRERSGHGHTTTHGRYAASCALFLWPAWR